MVPRWKTGDELYARRRRYRVVAVDETPVGDEIQGALVVEPLE